MIKTAMIRARVEPGLKKSAETPVYTKQFEKDVRLCVRRGKNLEKFKILARTLLSGQRVHDGKVPTRDTALDFCLFHRWAAYDGCRWAFPFLPFCFSFRLTPTSNTSMLAAFTHYDHDSAQHSFQAPPARR